MIIFSSDYKMCYFPQLRLEAVKPKGRDLNTYSATFQLLPQRGDYTFVFVYLCKT